MPSRDRNLRREVATYWARSGVADNGEVTLAAATDLYVQWVEKQAEMLDPYGNTITVDVQIAVGQQVTIGSIFAKGASADYAATDMKYKVVAYAEQRDLRNRFVRRTAGLQRYGIELPALA